MGCGSSAVPRSARAANIGIANSPSAAKTLLGSPVSSKLSGGREPKQSTYTTEQHIDDFSCLLETLSAQQPTSLRDKEHSTFQRLRARHTWMRAERCTCGCEDPKPTSVSPRTEARQLLRLTYLNFTLDAESQDHLVEADATSAPVSTVKLLDEVHAYVPRLQARQQKYLTTLDEASRGLAKDSIALAVAGPDAADTSEAAAILASSTTVHSLAKPYAPRLQAKHQAYLASLEDASGKECSFVEAGDAAAPASVEAVPSTPISFKMAARTIVGDKVAVVKGLADAASSIASSKPRVAAGLAVMAAAVAESMPKSGIGPHPSVAAGLAEAASGAAASRSAAATGLVMAAAGSAIAVARRQST